MLFALSVAMLTAPAITEPSPSAAEAVLLSRLHKKLPRTPFRVFSFRKTNGQRMQMAGIPMYRFFYEAQITFPIGYRPECAKGGRGGWQCMDFAAPGYSGLPPIAPGGTLRYTGTVEFQLTERGWIPA